MLMLHILEEVLHFPKVYRIMIPLLQNIIHELLQPKRNLKWNESLINCLMVLQLQCFGLKIWKCTNLLVPHLQNESVHFAAWKVSFKCSSLQPAFLHPSKNKTRNKRRVCLNIFLCLYCFKLLSKDVSAKFFGSHLGRRDEVSCCHRVCCQGCI